MSRQRLVCLYIYTAAALFCVSAQFHTFNESDNGVHLLPAYTVASRADLLNSATCGVELRDFQNAVDQRIFWGLKILDSSGSPKSGFFYGNNVWLGSRDQCLDTMNKAPFEIAERRILNNTKYRNPQNEFPPFEVNYFVAHLRHNSTLQYHFGINEERNEPTLTDPQSHISCDNFIANNFYSRLLPTTGMRFTEFRSVVTLVLDNYSTVQYHLLHMSFLLIENIIGYKNVKLSFITYDIYNKLLKQNIITLGLCLPASCSVNNITFILEKICRDRVLLNNNLYSDLSLIQVKDLKDDYQWLLSGAIPLICAVLVLTFFMMISGTIYDIFIHQKYLKTKNKTIIFKDAAKIEMMDLSSLQKTKSVIGKILMCFSVYTNTKKIFCTPKLNAEEIPVIHGIRFLSMIWIIAIHNILFTWDYFDNRMWLARLSGGMLNQIISYMTLSVDTYFLLSGLLLSYIYLKDKTNEERNKSINRREKLNEFFIFVVKRFIRLTPSYIMMIGILQLNSTWYDKTSQFYITEKPHEICAKYWWRNLLYINNFFSYNTMCMVWSWYLSNDMQFFIICLVLLILSTIYFYTAVALLGTLLIGSIILSGYISYINEYVPTFNNLFRLLDVLYFPPWVRIGPYIIGIITGYIIRRLNKQIVLKKSTIILCWSLAGACNIFILFGLYNQQISVLSSAICVALNRTVWAIGIACIIIVCSTKHGGIVTEILTNKIWIPFSKLTYCAYLVNPVVINSIHLHDTSTHVEFLSVSAMTIGHLGISYFCAYVLSLMAELPYISLRGYWKTRCFTDPNDKVKIK